MKKLTFTLFIALAVACLFSVPCNAKGKAKHVVFIGLDGWGSYS
ncbi:alkaline phosphatase, partial [Bacteroides uniformis]